MALASEGCEKYRAEIEKLFGSYTDQALFVAGQESRGCSVTIGDKPNRNGTNDFCIFAINNEPEVRHDLSKCIQRAWSKFKGSNYTWRQWYAVCEYGTQRPKFEVIKCK